MRYIKPALASISLFLLCFLSAPSTASADFNNFVINDFKSDQTLTRSDRQGSLHIVENIKLTFNDHNHGILRAIPDRYKGHSLQLHINKVTSSSGAPALYTTYSDSGNTVIKIGDAARLITGPQQYTIDYTVRNVISFYSDHSELYWDVNGDQWQQQFEHVSVALHMPQGADQTRKPVCYTGSYGSKETNCTIAATGSSLLSQTTKPLQPGQTLSYAVAFEPGYFYPSKWYETAGEYSKIVAGLLIPIVVIGGSGLVHWWRVGRDPRGSGVIVPQYGPPDGMKPLAVGAINNFGIGTRDITATIIDLAVRRYIKIIETKQDKKFQKDATLYTLELTNSDITGLDSNEQSLIKALFSDLTVGKTAELTKSKSTLYSIVSSLDSNTVKQLSDAGYLRVNNKQTRSLRYWLVRLVLSLIVLLVSWAAFGSASTFIGTFIGCAILVFCLAAIKARTAKGVAAKEHIEGLKMYLEVAEKQRIEKLQSPNAAYAANSQEPVRTVELFEKLLPYAVLLGVEQQWAGKFEGLYTAPPEWYSGNWTAFNAGYLASSINSGVGAAVASSFTAPSSSSSSGFGGGGAGGGGGGGGGGGW